MSKNIKGVVLSMRHAALVSGAGSESENTADSTSRNSASTDSTSKNIKLSSPALRSGGDGNGDLPPKKIGD